MGQTGASAAARASAGCAGHGLKAAADQQDLPAVQQTARPGFATRSHAALLEAMGWQVAPSTRRERAYHPALNCCFILRDGSREEAAFGYTGLTAPGNAADPALRSAQMRVERFLDRLGERSGVLLQNTPLVAFGGKRRDRVVVFGGWRFHDAVWRPFLLSPEGLGGVAIQAPFFAAGTAPQALAEVCGAPADTVLPRVTDIVGAMSALDADPALAALEQPNRQGPLEDDPEIAAWTKALAKVSARERALARTGAGLRIVPFADGWSVAQPGLAAVPMPLRRRNAGPARPGSENRLRLTPLTPQALLLDIGEDEFRFRGYDAGLETDEDDARSPKVPNNTAPNNTAGSA